MAWAAVVRPLARSAERVLLNVVEAVAANVTGTRLSFEVQGQHVSFVLDHVRAERMPGPNGELRSGDRHWEATLSPRTPIFHVPGGVVLCCSVSAVLASVSL